MTHYYKYENMREEDRNSLIPAVRPSQLPPSPDEKVELRTDKPHIDLRPALARCQRMP